MNRGDRDAPVYRIEVYLKNGLEETEPMSEDVARETFERLQALVRIVRNPTKMIPIGSNLVVRAGDIELLKLVRVDEEDESEGEKSGNPS